MSSEVYVLVRHKSVVFDDENGHLSYSPMLWPAGRELPEGWEVVRLTTPYPQSIEEHERHQRLDDLEGRVSRAIGPSDSSIHSLEGRVGGLEMQLVGTRETAFSRIQHLGVERLDSLESDLRDKLRTLKSRLDSLPVIPSDLYSKLDKLDRVSAGRGQQLTRICDRLDVLEGGVEPRLPEQLRVIRDRLQTLEADTDDIQAELQPDPLDEQEEHRAGSCVEDCPVIISYGEPGSSTFFSCIKGKGHSGDHTPGRQLHPGFGPQARMANARAGWKQLSVSERDEFLTWAAKDGLDSALETMKRSVEKPGEEETS